MEIDLEKSLEVLKSGGVLLYPTDTVWGLGCDATNPEAVAKIYALKQRAESKSMIVLANHLDMIGQHTNHFPDNVKSYLKTSEKPTTVIYQQAKNLAENVIASDQSVAIRLVNHDFCEALISKFGKPIVSTSANISGKPTPMSFEEIEPAVVDNVDYVVSLQRKNKAAKSSRIIAFNSEGEINVLRD